MARYIQKLSFGIEGAEWWVGWEIDNFARSVAGLIPADQMAPEELEARGVATFQKVSVDLLSRIERRTVQRVRLMSPYHGRIGATEVRVLDLSTGGAGIAHERPIRPGKIIELDFTDGRDLYALAFEVLRCHLSRSSRDDGEVRYYSSLKLRTSSSEDRETLERLVKSIVSQHVAEFRDNPGETLALL